EEGWQNDLMTPIPGLTRDLNLRPDIDLEKIGTLKPVFERGSRGTLTAANSTPLTHGASGVLLASEEWAKARGVPILA
ncbi:acetyl-CoA C-acyltransferase, partial [Pseudomonas aeruginosa]